jgi:RNA polymerase sigma factor for flagellar operon FliA
MPFQPRDNSSTKLAGLAAGAAVLDLNELWQGYIVSRDDSFRNKLMLHYLPVVKAIARHLFGRMPPEVELDDLAQAGILGLRDAIAAFDPSRGVKFENYCGQRVRGAILDYLRSLDWAPRMLRRRMDRVREAALQHEMSTGEAPTTEQLCSALGMPAEELQQLQKELTGPARTRVRISGDENDSDDAVNLDLLPDHSGVDPFREALRADLREFLSRGLNATERQILMLYYYENLSFREIGEALDLCESRVSQLHAAVLERLRQRKDRLHDAEAA